MKVLILAAGYATRLYPYTRNFPKPLLKIHDKPIIEYLVEKLAHLSCVSEIVVVTNGRFYRHFLAWKRTLGSAKKIAILNDRTKSPETKLGAIGDMRLAFEQKGYDDDYLVLGGDNFFDEPLEGFTQFCRRRKAVAIGAFDIQSRDEARHYGVVSLQRLNRVVGFEEKPVRPRSSLVATCLYFFPKQKVGLIRRYLAAGKHSSDAAGAYIKWLVRETPVYAYVFKHFWIDIGHIHTYTRMKKYKQGATA